MYLHRSICGSMCTQEGRVGFNCQGSRRDVVYLFRISWLGLVLVSQKMYRHDTLWRVSKATKLLVLLLSAAIFFFLKKKLPARYIESNYLNLAESIRYSIKILDLIICSITNYISSNRVTSLVGEKSQLYVLSVRRLYCLKVTPNPPTLLLEILPSHTNFCT